MGERVTGIVKQARHFRDNGYIPTQYEHPVLPFGKIKPDSKEAIALTNKLKPELFALGLLFADRIINEAYAHRRGEWGLVAPLDESAYPVTYQSSRIYPSFDDAFQVMGRLMQSTLEETMENEARAFEVGMGDPNLSSAYRRLDMLTWFLHEINPEKRREPGFRFLMREGITTNCDVMSGLLDVAAKLGTELSPDDYAITAKNSFPLVAKLASDHSAVSIPVIEMLKEFPRLPFTPFDIENFQLVGEGDDRKLDFSNYGQGLVEHYRRNARMLIDSLPNISPTVGCLAQGNLSGNGSPIQKQWAWNSAIASEIVSQRRYPRVSFIKRNPISVRGIFHSK